MSLGHHVWVQDARNVLLCMFCGKAYSSMAGTFCEKHPIQPENIMRAEMHRQRLTIQSHDCSYGEFGPSLIHCPIDKPCTLHKLERLREAARQVHALSVTEERDYRCVRVVEQLREIHKIAKGLVA